MTPAPQYKNLAWIIPLLAVAAAVSATVYEARESTSPAPMLRLAALALAGLISWIVVDRWGRLALPDGLVSVALVGVVAYALWEWRTHVIPLVVIHHFVVGVTICKLLQHKRVKDYSQIFLLTLLMIVLAGVISPSLWFVVAVLFLVSLGVHALIIIHVERERTAVAAAWQRAGLNANAEPTEQGRKENLCGCPATSHRRVTFVAGVGIIGISCVVFLAFPRVRLDTFVRLAAGAVAQTGFSPDIRFDGNPIISESERPVCRVRLRRDGQSIGSPSYQPHFRLMTQDKYGMEPSSGIYGWASSSKETLRSLPRLPNKAEFLVAPSYDIPEIEQIYLAESLPRKQKLFHLYPAIALASDRLTRNVHYGDDGTLRADGVPSRGAIDYTVYSLDADTLRTSKVPAGLENSDRVGYLITPPEVGPKVKEIAQRLKSEVADPTDHAAIADHIKAYLLSGELTYTLNRIDVKSGVEPVEDLLLGSKKGHCEYFATAMTVLCQLADVPARIVAGYRGGEFNVAGDFYQVREKHAHAWVEVYLEDHGWTTYDPTPAGDDDGAGGASLWARITSSLEYAQYLWVANVVAFDTEDQATLWQKMDRWFKQRKDVEGPRLRSAWADIKSIAYGPPDLTVIQRGMYWMGLTLVALWLYFVVRLMRVLGRRAHRWTARTRRSSYSGFYQRVLRALARRGHRKEDTKTPREFANQLAQARPALDDIRPVTDLFYRSRFGGRRLTRDETAFVEHFLNTLD